MIDLLMFVFAALAGYAPTCPGMDPPHDPPLCAPTGCPEIP